MKKLTPATQSNNAGEVLRKSMPTIEFEPEQSEEIISLRNIKMRKGKFRDIIKLADSILDDTDNYTADIIVKRVGEENAV